MGDTIIIVNSDSFQNQLNSLPPDLRDSVIKIIHTTTDNSDPVIDPFFLALIISLCSVFIAIYFKTRKQKYVSNNTEEYPVFHDVPPETDPDCYYYNGPDINLTDADIISILQKRFTYYTLLSQELKARFLQRLKQFMLAKTFRLPKDETFKEIPVLLSAAAVQLTFGLAEFMLPWFQNININSTEYFANDLHALRILAGNVEEQTITIAWNQFLSGINDCEDGSNVGLHELAHALYYEYVVAENDSDKTFSAQLNNVMQQIDTIYNAGKNAQTLFSNYAFRNTQEFWAESIEKFFEKPVAMKDEFPDLFYSIKDLLKQDPLNTGNPVFI